VAERFLLVEDERSVPYSRLRLTSSRDYRRPPEVCVMVEPDGVTLALDPARADLLVDAELDQFADISPADDRDAGRSAAAAPRRFIITGQSLHRGIERGLVAARLNEWFERRAGTAMPASVGLLLTASSTRAPRLKAARILVLTTPTPELLDGLRQLPATSSLLGESLGPTTVAIAEDQLPLLQDVLAELGLKIELGDL
jgi:hypothetical protein